MERELRITVFVPTLGGLEMFAIIGRDESVKGLLSGVE